MPLKIDDGSRRALRKQMDREQVLRIASPGYDEEQMPHQVMPEIDRGLCVLCGDCVASCPAGALSLTEKAILLDEEQCAYCGDCEDVCPQGAIMLPFEIILSDQSETEGED